MKVAYFCSLHLFRTNYGKLQSFLFCAQVIHNELVNVSYEAADDVDEFDSVSAAGQQMNDVDGRPNGLASPDNPSDSDAPPSSSANNNSKTFPAHLVKKYTLTYNKTNRDHSPRSPTRQPIPEAFMPHNYHHPKGGKSSHRSHRSHHGPPIPPELIGSLRGTVTMREMHDPRTRTSVIERVIREPVPVPYPIYQPPQVIREVKPVFVPQPPEVITINTGNINNA